MNIIYIKQAVKAKVNKKDTQSALLKTIADVLKEDTNTLEHCVINTSDIDGVEAGGSILLVANQKLNKYVAMSLGASTKDVLCVTDDGLDATYSFEYVLHIDKKVTNGKHVNELLEESKTNSELHEALKMVGSIADKARFDGVLSGNYGELAVDDSSRYKGILIVDYRNFDAHCDIETEVLGRKGKLHLLQIVPTLSDEIDIVKLFEDPAMTEIVAMSMCKNGLGTFSNRKKKFNFSNVLPMEGFTEDDCKNIGASIDKDNNFVITTKEQVEKFLELKF